MEIFGITVEEVTIALTGITITGIGVIIVLIFNIKAINENSKNQEYQMLKDFFESFHEIQRIPVNDLSMYITEATNFCLLVYELHKQGIVKKNIITSQLYNIFGETIWFYHKGNADDDGSKQFLAWCEKNRIYEKEPVNDRIKNMKSLKMDIDGFNLQMK